ncbi:MAG: ABC transporter permease [Planctomycetes bacterium]|nr:ABC transporter permease [Planctomycetota bacterium]
MPWKLLLRNVLRHPIRALLTSGSVAVAVFLMCVLDAAYRGLDTAVAEASKTRLWVQSAVSLFVDLPESYQTKIESVPGVKDVVRFQWFGGIYQDPSNFFAQFGVDPAKWAATYPEVQLVEGTLSDWEKGRTNCIIGKDLANRFGWRVGDRVPLIGTIFARVDGSVWDFTIAGIYESKSVNVDQGTMFFHFEYLRETLEQGAVQGPSGVGVYLTSLQPGQDASAVIANIEQMFENGPQRVRATTEAEFQRQFVTMLGSVPTLLLSIGGGVLFAIFFAVLNTVLMAARERTRDVGILKALGFGNGTIGGLLLVEAVLLCAIGGAFGAGLALAGNRGLWSVFNNFIPGFSIHGAVALSGLLLSIAIGLLAGALPALRMRSIAPVTALRMEA